MKYKKKYNVIFCFMLVIVVAVATVFFLLPKFGEAEREMSQIQDDQNFDDGGESEDVSSMKKVSFCNFSTALRHAYAYLDNASSYQTTSSGKFSLNVKNLVNIEQEVRISSEINNKNSTYHTKLCTYGSGKIKNDIGFEFTQIGNEMSARRSKDVTNGVFDYENKDVERYSLDKYFEEWKVLPQNVFSKFSLSKVQSGGKLTKTSTKNGDEYTLVFTLEKGEITDGATFFVKKFFNNSKNAQAINPKFQNVNIIMTLDAYGRPKTIRYDTSFYDLSLYGAGIPLSGLSGDVTYTQSFFGYGQNITISPLPDKV